MAAALLIFVLVLALAFTASTADLAPTGSPIGSPVGSPIGSSIGSPVGSPIGSSIGSPVEAPANAPGPAYDGAEASPGIDVIEETCALAKTHVALCVAALSSEPPSRKATKEQLASIMLRLAARNATENVGYIIGLADQSDAEPNQQQCLTDCTEHYQDAIEQVKDALTALDDAGYEDAITWIQAAMSDVKVCQEGCKEMSEHKNVLTKRNGDFNRLCSIAISIIRSLI